MGVSDEGLSLQRFIANGAVVGGDVVEVSVHTLGFADAGIASDASAPCDVEGGASAIAVAIQVLAAAIILVCSRVISASCSIGAAPVHGGWTDVHGKYEVVVGQGLGGIEGLATSVVRSAVGNGHTRQQFENIGGAGLHWNVVEVKVVPVISVEPETCQTGGDTRARTGHRTAVSEDGARIPSSAAAGAARVCVGQGSDNELCIQGATGFQSDPLEQAIFQGRDCLAIQNAGRAGFGVGGVDIGDAAIYTSRSRNAGVSPNASAAAIGGSSPTIAMTVGQGARAIRGGGGDVVVAGGGVCAPQALAGFINGIEATAIWVEVCRSSTSALTVQKEAGSVFHVHGGIVVARRGVRAAKGDIVGTHGQRENEVFRRLGGIQAKCSAAGIGDVAACGRYALLELEDILLAGLQTDVGKGEGGLYVVGEAISAADEAVRGGLVAADYLVRLTDEVALVPF